jgi:hypothetical protein
MYDVGRSTHKVIVYVRLQAETVIA